jgi:hypothetical protein
MRPWSDDYLAQARKTFEGLSGENAHNRMMQQGSRQIASNKSSSYNQIFDNIGGANPGLVRELLSDVNQSSSMAAGNLGLQATQYKDQMVMQNARHLEGVGTMLKQLEEAKAERARDRKISLVSNIIGSGIGLAGTGIGAFIGGGRLGGLKELLMNEEGDSTEMLELIREMFRLSSGAN